jgi:hypothetical protein
MLEGWDGIETNDAAREDVAEVALKTGTATTFHGLY